MYGKCSKPEPSNYWFLNNFINDFADAGADIITFHPEATPSTEETIKLIKKFNKKVGISLKPKSDINLIEKFIEEIDLILHNDDTLMNHYYLSSSLKRSLMLPSRME